MTDRTLPLGIYYEHPEWFKPLFAELDRRGVPYVRLLAHEHGFPIGERPEFSLVLNRMSPSAYLRGHGNAILSTQSYLAELESRGVRVVNGSAAYRVETSKAIQLSLLESLGLPYPRARVINRADQAPAAAEGLRFPVAFKPNIGGSGAGVRRFETPEDLRAAVDAGELDLGIDSTALVQEFIPADQSRIIRVEVLDGRYLYAIRIYTPGNSFDLCPADVCQTVDGAELDAQICAVDARSRGLTVEGYTPPDEIVEQVERIMAAANIEVGGVEYMIDARDGRLYFYDVNALSNFVADAKNVVGFDPFARLVDFLEREASTSSAGTPPALAGTGS
jgi:biotin carboxylase